MTAQVTIRLSQFVTAMFYFDNGTEGDQVMVSPPTYNKARVAEGYDKLIPGKLELDDQDLVFYQESEDEPIFLKELAVHVKGFNLIFKDLVYKSHEDLKMRKALRTALLQKLAANKG